MKVKGRYGKRPKVEVKKSKKRRRSRKGTLKMSLRLKKEKINELKVDHLLVKAQKSRE